MTTLVSGSPIVQNGKLIGAVTHVLVDVLSRGYGIFIESMLEEGDIVLLKGSHGIKLNNIVNYSI